jgi:hypothetical protein
VVSAVDAEKGTVAFDDKAPPELAGKTFPAARDAEINIDDQPGKLAGLPPGARSDVGLSADRKSVRVLRAYGPGWGGVAVKAVDAGKGTITFDDKAPPELAGKTFPVARDARVEIDGQPGKLAGVPPGASVALSLSADQKTVRTVQANGPAWGQVTLKAVDAGKSSVTFDADRAPAELAGKTFPLTKDAEITIDGRPGNLSGLPVGSVVSLALSADRQTVRNIHAAGPAFEGVLKAVDAGKGTVTFDDDQAAAELAGKTFAVAKDAAVEIDGRPGKLAGLHKGAVVKLSLSADRKSARAIQAEGPVVGDPAGVVVKAVDAGRSTITVEIDGEGQKTFAVAKDAAVEIDGKPGKLAGVAREASVTLTLSVDQKTVRRIRAKGP